MQKLDKLKIDSVEYQIQDLLASQRNTLLLELLQLAGGAASGLGIDDDIDIGKIVKGLMVNGSPREMSAFIKQTILDSVAFPKLDENSFETHFCEHYTHQIDVLEHIIIVNFGSAVQKVKKKLATSDYLGKIFSMVQGADTTRSSQNTSGSSGKSIRTAKQLSEK